MRRLLSLPSYLLGVSALFWCFQFASLTGFIQWWSGRPSRNDIAGVVRFLKWAFKYRVVKLGTNDAYRGKCVYLANHRSWADFFVDMYVTGCRGVPLSRLAVGMAFPAFTSSLLAVRSILLFNRANIRDTEKFNKWLDGQLASGPQQSLLVYPEGSRSQLNESLPLKRGMLRYAFTRRLPVQAVITAHKEEILNERRGWAHLGRTVVTGCSDVVESSRFEDFKDFMAAVQGLWDAQWAAVHGAQRQSLPALPEPAAPPGNYSVATLAKQSAALAFWTAVLVFGTRMALRALARLAMRMPAGRFLAIALVAWTVASVAAAALLPPPTASRQGRGSLAYQSGAVDKDS